MLETEHPKPLFRGHFSPEIRGQNAPALTMVPEICLADGLTGPQIARRLIAKEKPADKRQTHPLTGTFKNESCKAPLMASDDPTPVGIAARIMPVLDSGRPAPERDHEGGVDGTDQIALVKKFCPELIEDQTRDFLAHRKDRPWAFSQKATPSAHVALQKGAACSQAGKMSFLVQRDHGPEKPQKIAVSGFVEAVPKGLQHDYSLLWEEEHSMTSCFDFVVNF